MKPYWLPVLIGTIALLLSTPAQLFHPLVWRFIVDEVILLGQKNLLLPAVLVMVGVHILGAALGSLRTYLLGVAGQKMVRDLRNEIYRKMQQHSMQFFHDRQSGDILSRAIGDVDTLEDVAINGVDNIIASFLQFLIVGGVIVILNWKVGLITLAPMVLVALAIWIFNKKVGVLYRSIRDRLGNLSGKLQENILGMLVIKVFGRDKFEIDRFEKANQLYLKVGIKGVLARAIYQPSVFILGFISSALMVGVGAIFVLQGEFTIGGLVAYRGYWWFLFSPISTLAQVNEMLQRAIAALSRIFELLDEPLEIQDPVIPTRLEKCSGKITCSAVSFAYPGGPNILHDMNFTIDSGRHIGIVGPSGAGKSTILNLTIRLYDPNQGSILLDGYDLRSFSQEELRQYFAVVTQEPFLFNDTIEQNILYGRLNATQTEIREATKLANAADFIEELPNKYATKVGERGLKLSGGQKQRICIARAFLADPRILLLDEATASVEPESESLIQSALGRLMENRTTMIVSHRLSMVRDCHAILVIENGKLSDYGNHNLLMNKGGWYARMYNLQMQQVKDFT